MTSKRRLFLKNYYAKNREKILEKSRLWHLKNKERKRFLSAKWYEENRERKKKYHQRWKKMNPGLMRLYAKKSYDKHKERSANRSRLRSYGITAIQISALLKKQRGKCAICLSVFIREYCVDHCHKTGLIRGFLCRRCNSGIGFLNDDDALLARAIRYLRSARQAKKLQGVR